MTLTRWIALGVAVVAAGAVAMHVMQGADPAATVPQSGLPVVTPRDRPVVFTRSEECRECHPAVYAEWEGSHHALAYVNPEVQRLSNGFENRDCLPCHVPRPILETGLEVRPLERGTRLEEGVDCFTCHSFPKANVMIGRGPLGPNADAAPCQPAATPAIASLGLCAPCHNQHKVHEEWKQTTFAQPGNSFKDCNDCHMPKVERGRSPDGTPKMGRSHRFPAAHDAAMLKTSATLEARDAGQGQLLIKVSNTGTGHNFPTDERHRAVDLMLFARDANGREESLRVDRYRNPYREGEEHLKNPLREPGAERSWKDSLGAFGAVDFHAVRVPAEFQPQRKIWYPESTQIQSGEARSYTVRLPPGVTSVSVRLYYHLQPYQPVENGTLLDEKTLQLH